MIDRQWLDSLIDRKLDGQMIEEKKEGGIGRGQGKKQVRKRGREEWGREEGERNNEWYLHLWCSFNKCIILPLSKCQMKSTWWLSHLRGWLLYITNFTRLRIATDIHLYACLWGHSQRDVNETRISTPMGATPTVSQGSRLQESGKEEKEIERRHSIFFA